MWCLLILAAVVAEVANQEPGYSPGILPDCPGSTKKVELTRESLEKLSIVVFKSNDTLFHDRYSYYQMEQLARDPDVDFSRKTMVFCTGYMGTPFLSYAASVGNVYKQLGYNVFMLDTLFFTLGNYPRVARVSREVGRQAAKMLVKLTKRGLNPKTTEIIGISLGGQLMSFIAKNYKATTGVSFGKLIALDPAGSCFRNLGPDQRLDRSDGDFVIHVATNIDGYSVPYPVGHVTFYVNGGDYQPATSGYFWNACSGLCSHTFSYDIWEASLKHPNIFIGIQCDSVQHARNKDCFDRQPRVTNLMGPKTNRSREGIFYLATTNREPFGMGKRGLRRENDFYLSLLTGTGEEDLLTI